MATEVSRLDDQLKRALEGEAWHGPSVLESLAGISAAQAAIHPIAGAHSIWELVLHILSDYELASLECRHRRAQYLLPYSVQR
jgi:hypothetical protein